MAAEIVQRYGGVDILVNNLGPYADTPFLKLPEAQWDWVLNTNLKAVYVLIQQLAPGMNERGWGRIINVAAGSAFLRNHSVYGLAKAAVMFLTEALELKPGATVNAGGIRTNSLRLWELPIISVGEVTGEGEWSLDEERGFYRRLIFQEGRLTGFMQVGGDIRDAGIFSALIKSGERVDEPQKLFAGGFFHFQAQRTRWALAGVAM